MSVSDKIIISIFSSLRDRTSRKAPKLLILNCLPLKDEGFFFLFWKFDAWRYKVFCMPVMIYIIILLQSPELITPHSAWKTF